MPDDTGGGESSGADDTGGDGADGARCGVCGDAIHSTEDAYRRGGRVVCSDCEDTVCSVCGDALPDADAHMYGTDDHDGFKRVLSTAEPGWLCAACAGEHTLLLCHECGAELPDAGMQFDLSEWPDGKPIPLVAPEDSTPVSRYPSELPETYCDECAPPRCTAKENLGAAGGALADTAYASAAADADPPGDPEFIGQCSVCGAPVRTDLPRDEMKVTQDDLYCSLDQHPSDAWEAAAECSECGIRILARTTPDALGTPDDDDGVLCPICTPGVETDFDEYNPAEPRRGDDE